VDCVLKCLGQRIPVKVLRVENATANAVNGEVLASVGKAKSAHAGQWSEPVSCGHMSAPVTMSFIPTPVSPCKDSRWYSADVPPPPAR